ncbi:hypothetical protein KTT_19830 [Tengunoibacter tsumagoiensis]|uniref:Uncharacterized protein n=1 Tax=Tengunoibacter tsumagoiensis TaxID=2014871 RepID=A0A401ZZ43_9CHLR|nr:hypothetical protein KTT_19830 [Tengunoibacter tsumagoiensis]
MLRCWRIYYSDGLIIELWRVRMPTRFAKAMVDGTSFQIKLWFGQSPLKSI